MAGKTVNIPLEIIAKAETLEDIEDWLIVNDPESIKGLMESRRQHLCGELVSLEQVKERLARKSPKN
jgi:hypothetical protein